MIQILDSNQIFNNNYYIIVPFSYEITGNIMDIQTYDIFYDIAYTFHERFITTPFSNESSDYLKSKIEPIINKYGYEIDDNLYDYNINYYIENVNTDIILDSTVKYDYNMKYENITDIDFDLQGNANAYITIINEKIVSYAMEYHINENNEDIAEIGTETHFDYKNKGYSSSNTAALTQEILNKNMKPKYMTYNSNIPSKIVAEKVGFKEQSKIYSFVCYRR